MYIDSNIIEPLLYTAFSLTGTADFVVKSNSFDTVWLIYCSHCKSTAEVISGPITGKSHTMFTGI